MESKQLHVEMPESGERLYSLRVAQKGGEYQRVSMEVAGLLQWTSNASALRQELQPSRNLFV